MRHSHLLLWQKARDERREETAIIHSFIPLRIGHNVPGLGRGAVCFKWTEVWSRLSSELLGCFQVDGYELLLQQDLHPVYLGQKGESAAESLFHFYSEGKAPGWFMESLRRLRRKLRCKIHAPQSQQRGPRSGSHSAGTEAAARPLPAGTSGGAVCNSVKIKPQQHIKKGWRSDETLSFFFSKMKILLFSLIIKIIMFIERKKEKTSENMEQ